MLSTQAVTFNVINAAFLGAPCGQCRELCPNGYVPHFWRYDANSYQQDNDFELFNLAQSWPQTTCWSLNKEWTDISNGCSSCLMPEQTSSWTLHGLWPSNRYDSPSFCTDEIWYNPKAVSGALRVKMEAKWPSFHLKTSNDNFWSHEFKKHGTCALQVPSTNTLEKYFNKAVELLDEYNAGKAFASGGVIPGDKYEFHDMYQILKSFYGVNVYVKCTKDPETSDQYISQISVCFDKSFNLVDCNDDGRTSNCKWAQAIIYPKTMTSCSND